MCLCVNQIYEELLCWKRVMGGTCWSVTVGSQKKKNLDMQQWQVWRFLWCKFHEKFQVVNLISSGSQNLENSVALMSPSGSWLQRTSATFLPPWSFCGVVLQTLSGTWLLWRMPLETTGLWISRCLHSQLYTLDSRSAFMMNASWLSVRNCFKVDIDIICCC